ncbi:MULTISPECIES: FFLEELY motif protein [unclassified Acinetobacter]|uniref:FFLEELY motif protein n=1 Tax=unclassified Acinetobacter TaxID=196816 RepID=UPI002934D830|nr:MULTISPECIES: hypothetical protein [unclassified Acinetobacter]WOE30590.1 hypothetical protein QSG84_09335 [Acinetobacter sp. SAAs470]WOE38782.1 hypothetical protein QSG86_03000 [Acinetobacter sp. SAAs474]
MAKLAVFDTLLERYHQLDYHRDQKIFQRLQEVQSWKRTRLQYTHRQLFSEKANVMMAEYFLNRLYGGPDFDQLAAQIARLMQFAHKAEKLIPENALKTGTLAISLAILAVQLDEDIAVQLLKDYPASQAIDDEMMRLSYLKLDQLNSRQTQLKMLNELGLYLDRYMRSFMIYTAFKMCKSTAYKYQFIAMYQFIEEGFAAIKPLKSAEKFIHLFTSLEQKVIEKVHTGHPDPFK